MTGRRRVDDLQLESITSSLRSRLEKVEDHASASLWDRDLLASSFSMKRYIVIRIRIFHNYTIFNINCSASSPASTTTSGQPAHEHEVEDALYIYYL
mmetsp:Transcript_5276/g.13349  ORF Transcript_5276/g.13349 Transcript_5276/m.13349 type:complete len:97 (-) Transcript_5276:7323-7613(-)